MKRGWLARGLKSGTVDLPARLRALLDSDDEFPIVPAAVEVVTLSDAVRSEGYTFIRGDWRDFQNARLGKPQGPVAVLHSARIVCPEDSWDYAYSAAHEIAEHRYGFCHSATMFEEQANILARWHRMR